MAENTSLSSEWIYREYINRENQTIHAPYEPEMDFYRAVKTGDLKNVRQFLAGDFSETKGLGVLSQNNVRNIKYHFIITAAMISRVCIDSGLAHEKAYSLSDFYIEKVDRMNTLDDINKLHDEMVIAYTELMYELNVAPKYSRPVSKCINYIYAHLHERIRIDALCNEVSLSRAHLSRLFKSETGMTIMEYISHQKIETAKNMLLYSEYSPGEIASILGYPSQSYFTECFRKTVGCTPKKYVQ